MTAPTHGVHSGTEEGPRSRSFGASPCSPSTSHATAMLDKIDAPPPQMVTCDYCAKMIDKRELKHHQVGVRPRRVHSPARRSAQARPMRARGQARSEGGVNEHAGCMRAGEGGQRRMRARPYGCTRTHAHMTAAQAFDCLQSELRIMQCPKGCGQNIEVPFMALVRLHCALGTVVMLEQTPAFRRAGAQSRQARPRRMSYGAGALRLSTYWCACCGKTVIASAFSQNLHRRTLSALILLSRLLIWSLPSWPFFAAYSSCTGCPRRVARRALKEHNSENIEFHLGLINKAAVQVCHAHDVCSMPRLTSCALSALLRVKTDSWPGVKCRVHLGKHACACACACVCLCANLLLVSLKLTQGRVGGKM